MTLSVSTCLPLASRMRELLRLPVRTRYQPSAALPLRTVAPLTTLNKLPELPAAPKPSSAVPMTRNAKWYQSTTENTRGQWSRPLVPLIFGVRPNSELTMTSVRLSMPRS